MTFGIGNMLYSTIPKFQAFRPIQVHQLAEKAELMISNNNTCGSFDSRNRCWFCVNHRISQSESNWKLTVSPHQLKDQILAHPLIQFVQANITKINPEHNELFNEQAQSLGFDHVIVLCRATQLLSLSTTLWNPFADKSVGWRTLPTFSPQSSLIAMAAIVCSLMLNSSFRCILPSQSGWQRCFAWRPCA